MKMDLEKQLASLVRLFAAEKIKYAIVGGVAVSLYGEPRMTFDIDVNISISQADISQFLKTAKRYGFCPLKGNIESFIAKTGVIPMRFDKGDAIGRCDIIIAQNNIELLTLKRARVKKINSIRARIASPEDLMIHKITGSRPRDMEDLRGILRRQKGKIDRKYIKFWLKQIDKADKKSDLAGLFENLIGEVA